MSTRLRRTKIVATLGPSTDISGNLKKIIKIGVNVFRLNFSHGSKLEQKKRVEKIRKIANEMNLHIAILGDLQGPKIRIAKFKRGSILLKKGCSFILDYKLKNTLGDVNQVGTTYKKLHKDIQKNNILILDDGRIQLKVTKVKNKKIYTEVIIGGVLYNNKGINKLGGGLSAKSITKKDIADIQFASELDLDYLAVSFPRNSEDIKKVKTQAKIVGSNAKIIAKIERSEAISTSDILDQIIIESDGIMIARGDLGIEIGDPELVGIQKNLIRRARQLNKIVITATQMMDSMIFSPFPTRAEVMDVANAVLDGSDAVMLSAETAVGKYPIETVASMSRVCKGAEKIPSINISRHRLDIKFNSIQDATAMSAMYAANHLKGVSAIIIATKYGKTALMTSRITSGLPIFALSDNYKTLNVMSLYRGVNPVFFHSTKKGIEFSKESIALLKKKNFLTLGDLVIFTHGDVMNSSGSTNTIKILEVA